MEANSTSPDELNGMLVIKKGAKATYLWFTDDGGKAFDTHGDAPAHQRSRLCKGGSMRTPSLLGSVGDIFDR